MRVRELSHKLRVSTILQVNLTTEHTEVTETLESSVSTMAYHITHKQYD